MNVQHRHDMGAEGFCVCPKCEYKSKHIPGTPCQEEKCPRCGSKLLREGSHHHKLLMQKKGKEK